MSNGIFKFVQINMKHLLYTVFDLICLNVVCLLAIKMALHFDYYKF